MVWLRQNLGYKALALFLSAALWGYVHLATGAEQRTLEDLIEIKNKPGGVVAQLDRDRVKVIVTGPGNRLEDLSAGDVETWVDLEGSKTPGRHLAAVHCSMNRDPDLLACRALPAVVGVEVQDQLTKTLAVKAIVSGMPPLGYMLATPEATPSTLTISGLRKDVSRVRQLIASVEAGKGEVDQSVRALPLDAAGQLVSAVEVTPPMVRVVAPLQIEQSSRQLLVNPSVEGQPAPGYRITGISARPRTVIVRGSTLSLARLDAITTRRIDVAGIKSSQTYSVSLLPVPGVEVSPESVQIVVDVEALQTTFPPRPPVLGTTTGSTGTEGHASSGRTGESPPRTGETTSGVLPFRSNPKI